MGMSADRNVVELSGRLVRDVKLGETRDGRVYGLVTIVIRGFNDKKADFFEVFIWNKRLIEFYGRYLKSGKRVLIRGTLSRQENQIYINVTEDYGIMICIDTRDLKKEEKGSLAWVAALEEENEIYESKLRAYEEREAQGKEESMKATETSKSKETNDQNSI